MDRITYISKFSDGITLKDIEEIRDKSMANNTRDDLTGALVCFKGVFYQILEGPPETLYPCLERIRLDPRHQDIFILDIKHEVAERLYARWKMKTVILDENNDPLITPIRNLLASLVTTHTTLKKYAPEEVLEGIQQGESPLIWKMKREEKIVVFCDLIAFSTLVENADIEDIEEVLNSYFEISLSAILNSGGVISKLLGDGFLAYYPISHVESALGAALQIIEKLSKKRALAKSPYMELSYCAIGLSAGPVLLGNIGSKHKMDYTILGDVVNSASRLESHCRDTGHSILFDHRFKSQLPDNSTFDIMNLGNVTPKGKTQSLKIYTLDRPEIPFDKTPEEIAEKLRSISLM
jgi:class 3 adenylate cyclase